MHWVVQNNLYNEKGFAVLMRALERFELPHDVIKVVPFSHELIPDINPENPVVCIGAYTMSEIAKEKGWKPGVFLNENFSYEKWCKHYGDFLLNPREHTTINRFDDMVQMYDDLHASFSDFQYENHFFRPCGDSKHFAGMVKSSKEFSEWGHKVLELEEESSIQPDLMILSSPIKQILREYRFFIVDGQVITGSQYKEGSRVVGKECKESFVIKFARKMADIWCPDKAFVLDVAMVPSGELKVIEINSMNSSGFYDCDMAKVVNAIEELSWT